MPTEAFHHYLTEQVARPWSRHPGVLRLRVEPLPPYEQSVMGSPGVAREWPDDKTYLGWIELVIRDGGSLGELMASVSVPEFVEHVAAVHTYPVREIYTIVSAGRPTEVGLRGSPAVQAITAVGAGDQRDAAVLSPLFDDVGRGLDQLRR